MASDEIPEETGFGFLSDDQIRELFDTNRPFAGELGTETMARFERMLTLHRAAFFLVLNRMGLNPTEVAKITYAHSFLAHSLREFLFDGIEPVEDVAPILHPMDTVLNGWIDTATEPPVLDAHIIDDFDVVAGVICEFLYASDEEQLRALGAYLPPETE